ncbi:MAG: hypothetical protein ACYTFD_12700 [Planctomycetota bacterium]|jgi:hypothetical protein
MKRTCALVALLFLGGCQYALDHEAFERATSKNPQAAHQIGADAEPVLSVEPGEKHYIPRGPKGARQVHLWSRTRDTTSVIDGDQLRKYADVVLIVSYPGPPPPPPSLTRKKR